MSLWRIHYTRDGRPRTITVCRRDLESALAMAERFVQRDKESGLTAHATPGRFPNEPVVRAEQLTLEDIV